MEHHLEKARHKKIFFFKSFIVSLIVLVIVCVIATFLFNWMANVNYYFYGINADDYAKVFTIVMGIWKILIIQFTLIPAIAMMCLEGHIKKNMM